MPPGRHEPDAAFHPLQGRSPAAFDEDDRPFAAAGKPGVEPQPAGAGNRRLHHRPWRSRGTLGGTAMELGLEGLRVLVTAGAAGIGRAIVDAFLEEGALV